MLVVHRRGEAERELEIGIDRATGTVADLLDVLGERGTALVVDGVTVHAELSLVETPLVQGSVVSAPLPPAPAGAEPEQRAVTTLISVAGMGAGRRLPLRPGTWLVGRHPQADVVADTPTVSGRHAELRVGADGRVEVRDLASHNGTWLYAVPVGDDWLSVPDGAHLRLGAVVVRFERRPAADRASALEPTRHADHAGRVTIDRPPRPALTTAEASLRAPDPPRVDRHHPGLVLLPALLPAVGGLATLAVTGNWLFALVPLLSPLIALVGWWHGRRRAGRAGRREEARFRHELDRLAADLASMAEAEVDRRRLAYPDVGEVVRRAESSSSRLWERRPAHADWLALVAGSGPAPWEQPLTHRPDPMPEALADVLDARSLLPDAPALVELADGGVLGIVGPPALARAVARALVLQAAVHHGPADLSLVVLASAEAATSWTWCRWLPHALVSSALPASPSAGDRAPLGVGTDAAVALVRRMLSDAQRRGGGRDRTGRLVEGQVEGPTRLVVVDDDQLLRGPRAPARSVLRGEAGPVAGIVVAASTDRLPASCTAVLELSGDDGRAELRPVGAGRAAPTLQLLAAGLAEPAARRAARALARFQDGEQADASGGLARRVGLVDLLGLAGLTSTPRAAGTPPASPAENEQVEGLVGRWRASRSGATSLAVPLGLSADGPVLVDLVGDGPHALVAGTTGAGKSELLRTWVTALATQVDPRRLTFILVDYKGGSAFDDCARLPHTVAVVTDLDESLAARALRCLEAEIRYREEVLRRAGVGDLAELESGASASASAAVAVAPPRLVVVVDEFATLAAELPEFLSSLVGVAQRGRSLGVHLILATQRPAGVVGENIRANTALRIALRVQDRHDSQDVIGDERAVDLPRDVPGRAVVRFGPGELVTLQVATVSGPDPAARGRHDAGGSRQATRELPATGWLATPSAASRSEDGQHKGGRRSATSDLSRLVTVASDAATRLGIGPARQPWPPPLPARLTLDELAGFGVLPGPVGAHDEDEDDLVPLALVDDPDRQAQYPGGWRPSGGNLLVAGAVGSGTTTALGAVAVALARRFPPDRLHLYGLDAAAGDLDPLAALPHCGGVVRLGDGERLARLVGWLAAELDRRRVLDPADRRHLPDLVLLVDGWSALQAELDGPAGLEQLGALTRVVVDGPAVGARTVIAADRPGAVRHQLAATIAQRLVLRLADPFEHRALGLPPLGTTEPGRAVEQTSGLAVQLALPHPDGLAVAVADVGARWTSPVPEPARRQPWRVGRLPSQVAVSEVVGPAASAAQSATAGHPGGWYLPLGIGSSELRPCGLRIHPGEHVLVAGPARSGRSSALVLMGEVARRTRPDLAVVGVAAGRSPLRHGPLDDCLRPQELVCLERWLGRGQLLVLVDDAEGVDDTTGVLARLVGAPADPEIGTEGVCVVAAGRSDALRAQYGSWVRQVRSSRLGLLLQPDVDVDGDLLGVRLPRRNAVPMVVGRGWLVEGGRTELVHLARPSPFSSAEAGTEPDRHAA